MVKTLFRSFRTRLRVSLIALLGSVFAIAAVVPQANAGVESKAVSHSESNANLEKKMFQPTSDAAEALRRLLALIDSLHEPKDLTPEQVTRFTGLELDLDPDRSGDAAGAHDLTKEWYYIYRLYPDLATRLPSLQFIFQTRPPSLSQSLDVTDLCGVDMDQFHAVLLHMGFAHTGSNRAGTLARQYQRGNVDMNVAHVGESREKIHHDCVWQVDAYFVDNSLGKGGVK